jgi:substrate-binding family protein/cytochrome c
MRQLTLLLRSMIILLALGGVAIAEENPAKTGGDAAEIKRLGERMYRDGLLSDGTPLLGDIKGDVPVDSTIFSCANCHTRSGRGSVEGKFASPPVNGATLFSPRYNVKDQLKNAVSKSRGVVRQAEPLRPAYTDETLAAALRGGVDPNGRELSPVMPRYNLNERDMQILVSYLKNLNSTVAPGVTETSLKFATIVTEDVSPADRQAMMALIETLVTINQQTKTQKKLPQFAKFFRSLENEFFRDISVSTWELKGDPSTWRAQLEAYYQKEPVFAFLGGISNQSWQPIHAFCETNKIPCLFPITDLPVISSSDWYTFYASKGYYQEGETAARFLAGQATPGGGQRILQIVRSTPQGEALAAGFTAAWHEGGRAGMETVTLAADQKLDGDRLQELLRQHQPTTVVIWSGEDVLAALTGIGADTDLPGVVVSSRYLGSAVMTIPEALRSKVLITLPYRTPEAEVGFKGYADSLTFGKLKQPDTKRIASRTFSMSHIFLQGLRGIKPDFHRDTLLDVISMSPDQNLPDFERYSFGPGQRYASKGCYIVQLDQGETPRLIKKSDWVVN